MAEVQTRTQNPTTRGRGGGRGGRGGFGGRNTTARRANGDKTAAIESAIVDDDSDIAQLRKQYGEKLGLIKELFEEWSDADILYALKETDGDVELTATRIADGTSSTTGLFFIVHLHHLYPFPFLLALLIHRPLIFNRLTCNLIVGTISQWGEVSKTKKPAARPKTKLDTSSTGPAESSGTSRPARGGRLDGSRGRGARGNDRARGSGRGRGTAHATTNGHRTKDNQLSVPTDEASAWSGAVSTDESHSNESNNSTSTAVDSTTNNVSLAPVPATTTTTNAATEHAPKPTTTQPAAKTWASMLRQSTAPKPALKPKEAPVPKPAEVLEPLPPVEPIVSEPEPEPKVEETPSPR